MAQIVLLGIGAGIAAALLFASITSGAVISLILFYLAPLPIMIVALGWSHWAGLIAALVASTGLATTLSSYLFLAFLLGIGLPAWWLCYLSLLARPAATPTSQSLEWYPVGRLLIWVGVLSAFVVVAGLLALGQSEESVRGELRRAFESILRRPGAPSDTRGTPGYDRQIDLMVAIAPPAAAMSLTLINAMLLWLAGRIVAMSSRLRRPWPDIAAMTFPAMAPALFAAAAIGVALARTIGLAGIFSGVLAASLATVYVMLGFAVLHSITRGRNSRGFMLAAAYVAVFLWPLPVLFALLGLTDSAFDIRGRFARKRGPPTTRT
jgi:hypothetical protein